MSGIVHSLVPGLQNLGILSDKYKQTQPGENGLKVLEKLCFLDALKTFDPSSPVDRTVGRDGRIIIILPTIHEVEAEDEDEEIFDIPCDMGNITMPEECNKIILETSNLNMIAKCMGVLAFSFSKILQTVADSGNFDNDDVKFFLEEIVTFLTIMISESESLPKSWRIFHEMAVIQTQLFDLYAQESDYNVAHQCICEVSNYTNLQKDFLQTCISESVGYESVMLEISAAFYSIFSVQNSFIVNVIARLKASKKLDDSHLELDNSPLFILC
jgi:hypothetical protein